MESDAARRPGAIWQAPTGEGSGLMKAQDYHLAIEADISPAEAIDRINQVPEWWTKGFEGKSHRVGDTFTTRFGDTVVDFEVAELVPGKKVVWNVVDCNLPFTQDKKEWK